MTSIADEIDRLVAHRDAGQLSDAEFEAAKARVVGGASQPFVPAASATSSGSATAPLLRRSLNDRWVGGVCGGIAQSMGVESWIVRLLFAIALVFGGFGLIPYVLLWIFVPPEGQ